MHWDCPPKLSRSGQLGDVKGKQMGRNEDLHWRLESIEERFAKVMNEFSSRKPLLEHHRSRIDEFEKRRDTIRSRLGGVNPEKSSTDMRAKSEAERDLENLMNAFERWVEHVDKEFNQLDNSQ